MPDKLSHRSCPLAIRLLVLSFALFWALSAIASAQGNALGTTSAVEGPGAVTDTVLLAVSPEGSAWTATANDSWLHVPTASGTGSATVLFTADANSGVTRTGTLTIGGETLVVTQAGSSYAAGAGIAQVYAAPGFPQPTLGGIAVDAAGNVYFGDASGGALKELSAATRQVTTLATGLNAPAGVAADGAGHVYVADRSNNQIKVWSASTQQVTTVISTGLSAPSGLAVDSAGNLYIADGGNNALKEWNVSTQQVTTLAGGLNNPLAVAVDAIGNVYFTDSGKNVKEWSPSTQQVTSFLSSGLLSPSGLAVDGSGNLYISDTGALKVWTAATGQLAGLEGTIGRLSGAFGLIAVDGAGDLYYNVGAVGPIMQLLRAFVDTTPKLETAGAGADSVPLLRAANAGDRWSIGSSDQAWLTKPWLTSGVTEEGATAFSVAANPGAARVARLSILGVEIPVFQQAWPVLLSASSAVVAPGGGSGAVRVTASTPQTMTVATVNASWLHLAPGLVVATGSKNVVFTADPNTGPARSGTLTIGGQTFTVTQPGAGAVTVSPAAVRITGGVPRPYALASDAAGNLYFTSASDWGLREQKAATGEIVRLASGFAALKGVAVGPGGNVYFVAGGEIDVWDAATQQVTTVVPPGNINPEAVAVDAAGNVFFTNDDAVKEWNAATQQVTTIISVANSRGIAVDIIGNVFVTDPSTQTVQSWNAVTHQVSTIVSSGLSKPDRLAVDRSGDLYISDAVSSVIAKWDAAAGLSNTISSPSAPSSVAVDGAGNLYIADLNANSLLEWNVTTFTLTTLAGGLGAAGDLAVDPFGNVYVGDPVDRSVKDLPSSAVLTTKLVSLPPAGSPGGVAVDLVNNVYVSDVYLGKLQVWSPITQQASDLVTSGLNNPLSIAVDTIGNVYIADNGNEAVKKWDAMTHQVTTLVNTGAHAPLAVKVDLAGNVYYWDGFAVQQWNAATQQVSALFSASVVSGMAVDAAGDVFISDPTNGIQEWDFHTQQLSVVCSIAAGGFLNPGSLALDGAGNIFVSDAGSAEVKEIVRGYVQAPANPEPWGGGVDTMAIFPAGQTLRPVFTAVSDAPWLTIGGITGGLAQFNFTSNLSASPRTAHLTVLGQTIAVTQSALPVPIALADQVYANSAAPLTIDVLANDLAPSGFPLTVTSVTRPSLGHVVIGANGTLTYTPPATMGTLAQDSFFYTVTDGYATATAQVTVRNPYFKGKGSYQGLILNSGGPLDGLGGGSFSLALTSLGSFTGAVKLGVVTYAFKGTFGADGKAQVTIQPPGRPAPAPLVLSLQFDEAAGNQLSGTIAFGAQSYTLSATARESYAAVTNPDPAAGYYTLTLPAPAAPVGTTATAAATVTGGNLTGVTLTGGGSGYVVAPRVTIVGAPGRGATAVATVSGGVVTGVIVKTAGLAYLANGTTVTIDPPSAGVPAGTGWATMLVTPAGAVYLIGKLSDGTSFSAGAQMSSVGDSDQFTFYTPLFTAVSRPAAPGSVAGTVSFTAGDTTDLTGTLYGLKPPQTGAGLYPGGFSFNVQFGGSRYLAPVVGEVLDFTLPAAATATCDLMGTTVTLAVSTKNVVTALGPNPNKLRLAINPRTGTFAGTFVPNPATSPAVSAISGVIDRKASLGAGLFIGATTAGAVSITPD